MKVYYLFSAVLFSVAGQWGLMPIDDAALIVLTFIFFEVWMIQNKGEK